MGPRPQLAKQFVKRSTDGLEHLARALRSSSSASLACPAHAVTRRDVFAEALDAHIRTRLRVERVWGKSSFNLPPLIARALGPAPRTHPAALPIRPNLAVAPAPPHQGKKPGQVRHVSARPKTSASPRLRPGPDSTTGCPSNPRFRSPGLDVTAAQARAAANGLLHRDTAPKPQRATGQGSEHQRDPARAAPNSPPQRSRSPCLGLGPQTPA